MGICALRANCLSAVCVLQRVAVCCSMLQCVAGYLHVARELLVCGMCVTVCCSVLQHVAVCCSTSQCVAVRCSALQYVAGYLHTVRELLVCSMCVALVCCSMLQCVSGHLHVARELLVSGMCIAVCCSVGQCVTSLCSVLQCSALQDTCVLRVNCSSTVFVWCSVFCMLQSVAECCSMLQGTRALRANWFYVECVCAECCGPVHM